MKTLKQVLVVALVIIMMMSIMAMPASAVVDSNFYHFPLVTKSMSNRYMSAAVAVQKFLILYDPISYNLVAANGGTDGFFGGGSANAASHFQNRENLDPDGKVGSLTWMKIGELLLDKDGVDSDAPYYWFPNNSGNNVRDSRVIIQNKGYWSVDMYGTVKEVFYRP